MPQKGNKTTLVIGGGGGGSVSSVFTRTGAVTAQNGDYTASNITNVPSGSLTSTNLQSALNELSTTVDLKQFKTSVTVSRSTGSDYVCDGTADHVQIDAAIAAVYSAGGGIVYIKEGTYDISGRMTKKSNVILMGDGMGATNLIGGVVGDWMFYNTSAVSRFAISDMTLDCNNTTAGGLLALNKATECTISQVEFKNVASGGWHVALGADNTLNPIDCFDNVFKDCIFDTHAGTREMLLLMNAANTKVINCKFKNKTTTGPILGVYQQCENTKIIHCTWEDNVGFAGYYSLSCNNTTFFDCDIINTGGFQGANLADNGDFGYTQVKNVSFLYNRFEGGANTDAYDYNAIEMGATDNAKIIGNTISGYNIPIVCHDGNTAVPALSTNFVIENNTFFNNTISNTAFIINPCILFSAIGGSCYGTIKNNKCYDTQGTPTQKYPITFSGAYTWDNIEITGNRLSAYGGGTSIALANSAAIGSNVDIYENYDYSGTNPAQSITHIPTYTVGATGADYPGFTSTAIQAALDAGNGKIYLTDGNYVLSTGLKFKSNYQYIEGNGEKCIIQFNGATVPTAISPNATNLKQGGIKGVSIQQTNATVQGTALDISDMALMDIDVEIKDAGVAIKMNDANNNTFYNRVYIKAFGCARGIEMNGTNPSNHNYFSGRIANKSGGDYGIYIVKGQGNHFEDMSLEPVATTGNTGIYLTSASTYANTFENMWIEGNNVGVTVDSSVTYNTFTSGTITANTTNLTDNGKQTAFYNTQVGAVQKTNINPGTVIDNGNASDIAWNIKNNTSFAHVGGALVETELRNASDTSILNRWKHAGTGKFVSALNGATELFSVDSSGSSSTMLSQVQNIITKDTTINAGFSTYIPSYMEVGSGFTLTISDTAHLQVG